MDEQTFHAAYNESRNGANYFVRHPMARLFQYSDGVEAIANAGCHWLVDIIATEIPKVMRSAGVVHGYVDVKVADGKAMLSFQEAEATPKLWSRKIDYTDMPAGEYVFEIGDEGSRVAMILITEH